ncbi:conjugal transfer protein TraD [Sphingobium boeckii]|uniref:Conjugal transfer protein TraD n=1 Tax=Sphingobium boeckii TaxID=1082345 RepID=A0A7W9ALC6_9SPHN|nr:hypothetical protein [Sphingobium boeckii]
MKRRERTHHLIELGGLVLKSGLIELMEDDRFALYGALLDIAAQVQGENGAAQIALWQRRGKRAFRMEAEAMAERKV